MGERPRGPKDWTPTTDRQIAVYGDLLEQFNLLNAQGLLPRSGRGVFYDLRPAGHGRGIRYYKRVKNPETGKLFPFENEMEADPATVQEVLVSMRRAGLIREALVADDRAPDPLTPYEFENAEEAVAEVEAVVDGFVLPRQQGQDIFVEVWCEAAGIGPRLAVICEPFGVPVYPAGGFDGLKPKRAAAARAAKRDVPTIALHIGDYDRHGRWIFKAIAEDVVNWVPTYVPDDGRWGNATDWAWHGGSERVWLEADEEPVLTVVRFAVTEAQVEDGTIELDEEGKAEAEAMDPAWDILRDELDRLLDPARREAVEARDEEEQERLRELLTEKWSA